MYGILRRASLIKAQISNKTKHKKYLPHTTGNRFALLNISAYPSFMDEHEKSPHRGDKKQQNGTKRICSPQTSVCLSFFSFFFFCSLKHSSLDTGVVSQGHNTHTELRQQSFSASKAQRSFWQRRCHFNCWWEHCRHYPNRVRCHRFQSSSLCLPASFDVVP